MKRISLAVLAVALFFINAKEAAGQDALPDEAAWSKAVNLLPLIDPQKDAVAGNWKIESGKLMADSTTRSRLQIPFAPPKDYDFRIVFSRSANADNVGQLVSHLGNAVMWVIGCNKGNFFGFGMVDGKPARSNATTVNNETGLEVGRPYTSIVQVRRKGLKAFLNGKLTSQCKTDWTDVTIYPDWDIPNHRLIGIATSGPATFEKIDLIEVSGKGTPSRKKVR